MATRLPLHEIGKVQGESTNRNHLAESRSSYAQVGQKLGRRLFSVMAPHEDIMIYFIDYQLIKITVQDPT